jgi:type IV pilus assembly protein PilF
MFTFDERIRGLPAVKEQVVQVHQSLNSPHLAVPGRRAGPSTAWVLGLRGQHGYAVFVYLYLSDSGECAVYAPQNRQLAAEAFAGEESDALAFVESMGFIMDNLNFKARTVDEQDQMLSALPVFQREPPAPHQRAGTPGAPAAKPSGAVSLGKLFSAFCLVLGVLGCKTISDQDKDQAQIRAELAAKSLLTAPQSALKDAEEALKLDPDNADAWHIRGIILHQSFGRLEEAHAAFAKAILFKTPFSEAHTNLGNLLMDEKRYDDAIAQYEIALNDVMYATPFIALGNEGFAYFKKGDSAQAVSHLKSAITLNPKYCLGFVQLGQVYESQNSAADSCKAYAKYREFCPERSDAWRRDGVCLANAGQKDSARKNFETCVEKSANDDEKELCRNLSNQLK